MKESVLLNSYKYKHFNWYNGYKVQFTDFFGSFCLGVISIHHMGIHYLVAKDFYPYGLKSDSAGHKHNLMHLQEDTGNQIHLTSDQTQQEEVIIAR